MIRFELGFGLLVMAMWLFCLLEVVGSPEGEIRNLPKVGWLLIVVFFPFVGSVAWLVAGRPVAKAPRSAHERALHEFPEYDRPGRASAVRLEDDQDFLRRVRERAEDQRRVYRQSRLDQEREQHELLQRRLRRPDQQSPDPGEQ